MTWEEEEEEEDEENEEKEEKEEKENLTSKSEGSLVKLNTLGS